jgi:amino acid permease
MDVVGVRRCYQAGVLVDLVVSLNNFGVLTSYVVILGDLIPQFMSFIEAPTLLQSRITLILLCTVFILMPLSSLRKMGLLRWASLGCLLAIAVFVVVLLCMGAGWIHVTHATDKPATLFSSNFVNIVKEFPVMIFAYNCNMNVPILYGELRRQSLHERSSRFNSKRR